MVRDTALAVDAAHPLTVVATRKQFNKAANSLVHDAILKNDLPLLAEKLADMMVVTARILVGLRLEPDVESFAYACAELVTTVRKNFDDALRFDKEDDVKLAAVMMEVVLKGISATLALPLEKLMAEVLAAEAEGRGAYIRPLLFTEKEPYDSFVLGGEKL
jgi:hypothetical protein